MSHVVSIATKRIPLPSGEWIELKLRLNHGEYQDVMERCYRIGDDGTTHRLPFKWAEAILTTYLVDWSLLGLDEQPLRIRGCSPAEIEAAVRLIDQDIYNEIKEAVDAHVAEITRAQAEKKRARNGEPASSATSTSPADVTGATNGSAN